MTIITPISWSFLSIQINSMLIGTNTKLQLQQLNTMVSFWGATNALDVSLFVEWGIKDMVSNALIKLFGTI